jgi:uncharacterized protein DUF3616
MSNITMQPGTMRRALLGAALFALATLPAVNSVAAPAAAVKTPQKPAVENFAPDLLAPRPLCEASAALAAPWDESLVLVADNERDEKLYVFTVKDGKLVPEAVSQMPAEPRPKDIEALARLDKDVVVVGSHSRNSQCERKKNRQSLRRLAMANGTLQETAFLDSAAAWKKAMEGGGEQCVTTLFASPAPAEAGSVCEALVAAEKKAASGGTGCEVLNIEGAFGTADGRLWLGLRAPLVGNQAVLLRLVSGFAELRFDRVALLDLEGRGIRELALADNQVIGIAGPMLDADEPFLLFRAASPAVLAGGKPPVKILYRDLPTSSEGLLLRDGRAYVLVDGDAGEGDGPCKVPAGWYPVELQP